MEDNKYLKDKVNRRYSIIEIIKTFITPRFTITRHNGRIFLSPCPFSGSDNSFSISQGRNGIEYYLRSASNYIEEDFSNVPSEGTAYDLLHGLFPDDNPIQLIVRLGQFQVPRK